MARLAITKKNLLGNYPTLPISANAADFAFTQAGADFADGASFDMTGREILIVHNGNVGVQTVTISSVPDALGRSGDITTYSLGIGEYAVFQFFKMEGWKQTNGKLYFAASAADVEFAVLHIED